MVTGSGSMVGFLGEELGVVWTVFLGAGPLRGSVGVQAGEGVQERQVYAGGGCLQAEPDEEEELEEEADEEEETRSSTAARGSMSGGGATLLGGPLGPGGPFWKARIFCSRVVNCRTRSGSYLLRKPRRVSQPPPTRTITCFP